MSLRDIFIASAVRTPIGKFGGALASLSAVELGTVAGHAAIERAGLAGSDIDQTIVGHARQAGNGPNVGRQVSIHCGVPDSVPAFTVNMACGSGLQAVALAAQQISLGRSDVSLVGGTESMSRVPYLVDQARWGLRLGHGRLIDGMYQDGFFCPLSQMVMGETAELLAGEFGIQRGPQDAFAVESHRRAAAAAAGGWFDSEIAPCTVTARSGPVEVRADEHIRPQLTESDLSRLPPVFNPQGTITAGNASGITDGAAALVVASGQALQRRRITARARIVDYAVAGVDPARMGLGPAPAIRQLLERQKLDLNAIDLFEINEAFAAQVLACLQQLPIDPDRLNTQGGAIALGHPIGCSGARVLVTLLSALERTQKQRGIAALCVSGGMGIAMLVERL